MTTPNFSAFCMRCSAIGALMTEPQLKADKEAGNLSATAKSALIREYSRYIDKRVDDIFSKPMQKGTQQEDESITLLSRYDGKFYVKNERRIDNLYITGECDINDNKDNKIIDIKSSWSNTTFLNSMMKPLDSDYYWQGQGYCWLYNRPRFEIAFVLVNATEEIIESEKRKYLWSIGNPDEHNGDIMEHLKQIDRNHTFDDMPIEYRVFKHCVERNDADIERIPAKVEKAREFMQQIFEKRIAK